MDSVGTFRQVFPYTLNHMICGDLLLLHVHERFDPGDNTAAGVLTGVPHKPHEVAPEHVHEHRLGFIIEIMACCQFCCPGTFRSYNERFLPQDPADAASLRLSAFQDRIEGIAE